MCGWKIVKKKTREINLKNSITILKNYKNIHKKLIT